jgi:chromosome segregation ATPase
MSWFERSSDPQKNDRAVALRFFQILEQRLGMDVPTYTSSIRSGQDVNAVFHSFVTALETRLKQLQGQIANWEAYGQVHQNRIDMLTRENDWLRAESARQRLDETRQKLRDLSALVETTQRDLAITQKARDADQESHQREVSELKKVIGAQNQIIAKQQLRLNQLSGNLLPGEPPSSDGHGASS